MGFLLGLALQGQVWASVPIELPESENPSQWRTVLVLGDLQLGPASGSSWVRVTNLGSQWKLVVQDRSGHLHEVTIASPETASDRERLVLLASSLLEPSTSHALPERELPNPSLSGQSLPPLPPLPSLPEPPTSISADPIKVISREEESESVSVVDLTSPTPIPTAMDPVSVSDPEPAIDPELTIDREPDNDPEPDNETESDIELVADSVPLISVPSEPDSLVVAPSTPIIESTQTLSDGSVVTEIETSSLSSGNAIKLVATGGFRWTSNSNSQPSLALSGTSLRGRNSLGLRIEASPWGPLSVVEGERNHAQLSAMATWFVQRQRLSAGLGIGARVLGFRDVDPSSQIEIWTPTISVGAVYSVFRMGPIELSIEPLLQLDLRPVDIRVDDQHVADWSPLAATTALSLGWIREQ